MEVPEWKSPARWTVWTRPCFACTGFAGQIPGSLLLWDTCYNNLLLEVATEWEFQRHLAYAERTYEH